MQVYIHRENQKRGSWSSLRYIIDVNYESGSVSVSGASGKKILAAFEYLRPALQSSEFGTHVPESIDLVDEILSELIVNFNDEQLAEISDNDSSPRADEAIDDDDDDDPDDILLPSGASHFNPPVDAKNDGIPHTENSNAPSDPIIGDEIQVFWPLEDQNLMARLQKFLLMDELSCTTMITMSRQHIFQMKFGDIYPLPLLLLPVSNTIWRVTNKLYFMKFSKFWKLVIYALSHTSFSPTSHIQCF